MGLTPLVNALKPSHHKLSDDFQELQSPCGSRGTFIFKSRGWLEGNINLVSIEDLHKKIPDPGVEECLRVHLPLLYCGH